MTGQLTTRPRPRASARFLTIRVTGVLLAVLALGHFGVTHIVNDVASTGSPFIARRWSTVLWVVWDGLLLGCALLHGGVALAAVVRDLKTDPAGRRRWLAGLTGLSSVLFLIGIIALLFASFGRA